MPQGEMFCGQSESRAQDRPRNSEQDQLRLKIGQCRGALAQLQSYYDADKLKISDLSVRADFRSLVMSLLWVAFRASSLVDFKLFGSWCRLNRDSLTCLSTKLAKTIEAF